MHRHRTPAVPPLRVKPAVDDTPAGDADARRTRDDLSDHNDCAQGPATRITRKTRNRGVHRASDAAQEPQPDCGPTIRKAVKIANAPVGDVWRLHKRGPRNDDGQA